MLNGESRKLHFYFCRANPSKMKVTILKMPNSSAKWDLVFSYFELRRQVFLERLNWDLAEEDGYEHEQYDSLPMAHYVVAQDKTGEVVAGARLLRCDVELGGIAADGFARSAAPKYSYMIRDATLGRINLPKSLMNERAPVDAKSWELTRLASLAENHEASVAVLEAAYDYIKLLGAEKVLCLGSPIVMRLAQKYGFSPVREGPICKNSDGSFLVFSCPVK